MLLKNSITYKYNHFERHLLYIFWIPPSAQKLKIRKELNLTPSVSVFKNIHQQRVFLLGLLAVICMAAHAQNPPKLVLAERIIEKDAFPISDGVQTFVFHYKNEGDSALVVSRIIPSCTCVVPEYSTTPLMPGDSTTFTVQFTPPHTGRFSQMLTICSNGIRPILRAYIRGIVTDAQDNKRETSQ